MNIQIGPKHRITSDSLNITVEELCNPKEEGNENWRPIAYFQSFPQAVNYMLERHIRLSDAQSLEALSEDVEQAKRVIYKAVQELRVAVGR